MYAYRYIVFQTLEENLQEQLKMSLDLIYPSRLRKKSHKAMFRMQNLAK
jgi:hypothetical protein